jgi:hypothetical protein
MVIKRNCHGIPAPRTLRISVERIFPFSLGLSKSQ